MPDRHPAILGDAVFRVRVGECAGIPWPDVAEGQKFQQFHGAKEKLVWRDAHLHATGNPFLDLKCDAHKEKISSLFRGGVNTPRLPVWLRRARNNRHLLSTPKNKQHDCRWLTGKGWQREYPVRPFLCLRYKRADFQDVRSALVS